MKKLAEVFNFASSDPNTKAVLLHGGQYFCSGNDLAALMDGPVDGDAAATRAHAETAVLDSMVPMLVAMANC